MHRRFISLEATRKLHRCFWKPWTVNEETETEWPRYSNSIYYSDTSFQTITCEQGTSPESSVHLKCTAPEFWHACRPNHGHQFDEGLRGFSWASNQHWSASWMLSGRRSTKGWAQQHQRHLQEHQCTAWLLRSGHITGLSDTRRICSASQTDFEQSGQKLSKTWATEYKNLSPPCWRGSTRRMRVTNSGKEISTHSHSTCGYYPSQVAKPMTILVFARRIVSLQISVSWSAAT